MFLPRLCFSLKDSTLSALVFEQKEGTDFSLLILHWTATVPAESTAARKEAEGNGTECMEVLCSCCPGFGRAAMILVSVFSLEPQSSLVFSLPLVAP